MKTTLNECRSWCTTGESASNNVPESLPHNEILDETRNYRKNGVMEGDFTMPDGYTDELPEWGMPQVEDAIRSK